MATNTRSTLATRVAIRWGRSLARLKWSSRLTVGAPNDSCKRYRSPAGAFAAILGDITRGPGDHVIPLMDDATYGPLQITNRVTDACYGLLNTNGSVLTVRNNIFSRIIGHHYAIGCNQATGTSSGVAEHNLMYGNTQDVEEACWSLRGTIAADPLFVAPGASPPDLHRRGADGLVWSGNAYDDRRRAG